MEQAEQPARVRWAFLFALRRESAPFLRPLIVVQTFAYAPCPACRFEVGGTSGLVLETGIGAERAGRAIAWVLDRFAPRLVIAAGFAGALSRTLAVGEVVVATEVIEPD